MSVDVQNVGQYADGADVQSEKSPAHDKFMVSLCSNAVKIPFQGDQKPCVCAAGPVARGSSEEHKSCLIWHFALSDRVPW